MRLPPLNALRAFEAAARHSSFRCAADELCVTQAAVSQHIRLLEGRLRVKLFARAGRGVALTSAGHAYLGPIQAAFGTIASATESIGQLAATEVLTLSVPPTFGIRWLMPRLSALHEIHPWIDVRLFVSISPVGVLAPDADAAIWHGTGQWPGVNAHRLFDDDRLIPVCSPRILQGANPLRHPGDLRNFTLLHASREMDDWSLWLRTAGVDNVGCKSGPVFDSTSGAVQAAAQGHGVAIGHAPFVWDDIHAGHLVAPFAIEAQSNSTYYLVQHSARKPKRAITGFCEWILHEAMRFRQAEGTSHARDAALAQRAIAGGKAQRRRSGKRASRSPR
jgi:LysR family transcriptional regulator, glycine cleavage system transcriptional activator